MREELILVDERNRAIGHAEKWAVHRQGLLHRAFSIFLVDATGRILLQQRSRTKYHSGGLWANSCCGHPRPGERTAQAAKRRLREELGAEAVLHYGFRARYLTALPNELTENEIVYVYFGAAPRTIRPNPEEVAATAWKSPRALQLDLQRRPGRYAYWLKHYLAGHFRQIEAGITGILGHRRRLPLRASARAGGVTR
jgi:isopentenyl-diphosphate delta-isomerase